MAGFWSKLFSSEDKPSSAQTAKDRLKVIVASEKRTQVEGNDLSLR